MSKRKAQESKVGKKYKKQEQSAYEEAPWWGKIGLIGIPIIFILGAVYLLLKDNSIQESELSQLEVTLSSNPKVVESGGKSISRWLQLSTYKYQDRLRINDIFAYKATEIDKVMDSIYAGNPVTLKIRTTDLTELQENSESEIAVFGLEKNGKSYTDLTLRNQFAKNDSKWALMMIPFGLIMLYYVLVKQNPKIEMDTAIAFFALILLAVFAVFYIYKKLN